MPQFIKERWLQLSACATTTDKTIIHSFHAATPRERDAARNFCRSECPVQQDCLKWALEHGEIWDVWGGCDESEIRRSLGVNSRRESHIRSRYPNCPNCAARPSKLEIIKTQRANSHRIDESIRCGLCGFEWRARTTVVAVRAYRRAKKQRSADEAA